MHMLKRLVLAQGLDTFKPGAIATGARMIPPEFALYEKNLCWELNQEQLESLWLMVPAPCGKGESFRLKASIICIGGHFPFQITPWNLPYNRGKAWKTAVTAAKLLGRFLTNGEFCPQLSFQDADIMSFLFQYSRHFVCAR
jgi:hypothetical protein